MFRGLIVSIAILSMTVGCGGAETDHGNDSPVRHALKMDVTLEAQEGDVFFLTPSNSIAKRPASEIVGKPFMFVTYPPGFSPGNDEHLDYQWGRFPESLTVSYSTGDTYADGPYDIAFVTYAGATLAKGVENGPPINAPPPSTLDISTFTISTDEIHEGDPIPPSGFLRLNVAGADASIAVANRVPADPTNGQQTVASFTNTLLLLP